MSYQTEFPEFAPATMPDIPAAWRDVSWHNDACPCFEAMRDDKGSNWKACLVWIDFADPALRDVPNGQRFTVTFVNDGAESMIILETDSWAEVLAYLNPRTTLGAAYAETIGYNPFLDDPYIALECVAATLDAVTAEIQGN